MFNWGEDFCSTKELVVELIQFEVFPSFPPPDPPQPLTPNLDSSYAPRSPIADQTEPRRAFH